MLQAIAKFIYFKIMGWTVDGTFPNLNKFVIIVVPHTSWVDFFLGLLIRKVWNQEINYVAKKSLFKPPFGWFFKWTGGAPIDRSKINNSVNSIVKLFSERQKFRLALSPEGTRKKVKEWKTGFYFIAKTANVPIVMVAFNFDKKQIKISNPYYTSDNKEADFKIFKSFFKGIIGKIPEYS
tara:strand:+ start:228241 stop:228780 length:540 start_codon:yes stop_codon:yes gene_type:complete